MIDVLFVFLFVSGRAPDTSQSLALPSSSAPLIFSALVSCYVTAAIGCARGRAGGAGNGTSGRSKAREGRSKVKRHRFMLLQQVLIEVLYQEVSYLSICMSICYLLSVICHFFLHLLSIYSLFLDFFISIPPPRSMRNNRKKIVRCIKNTTLSDLRKLNHTAVFVPL